jgi:hypothetical protein
LNFDLTLPAWLEGRNTSLYRELTGCRKVACATTREEYFCDLSRCLVRHCSMVSDDLHVAQPATAKIKSKLMIFFMMFTRESTDWGL